MKIEFAVINFSIYSKEQVSIKNLKEQNGKAKSLWFEKLRHL